MNSSLIEGVIREFEGQGYKRDDIVNEAEAWVFSNKNSKNIEALRRYLNSELKGVEKKVVNEENIRSLLVPSLITTYPAGYAMNDEVIQYPAVNIKVNSIYDQYFLESSGKIETNLMTHLNTVSEYFKETYSVEVKNILEGSEEDFWITGRIELNDDDDHEEYSLLTEHESIQLNLHSLEHYTIYPGQIILAKGSMSSTVFNPKELQTNALGDFTLDCQLSKKLKIGLISGPFTGPDLDFSPFYSVINSIKSEINVLILIGPFLDCENEKLKSCVLDIPSLNLTKGSFDTAMENIFQYLSKLEGINIVTVPHERELVHLYPLPMPQLSKSVPCKLTCAPSPAFLDIEKLNVHIIPYDVVAEITDKMETKSSGLVNKAQIALNQLIQQQCYLPIIPNTLPVEYSNFNHFIPNAIPDILIVNTRLSIQNNAIPGITCVKALPFVDGSRVGNYTIINATPSSGDLLVGVKNFRANF